MGLGQYEVGLVETLGMRLDHVDADGAVVSWDVGPQHLQPFGIVHGGVYCAAVETAASCAAQAWLGERGVIVGVNNQTDFLRAVRSGRLTAVATPLHRGRSQQLWLVEITDEQQRMISRGQVRLQNLDANPSDRHLESTYLG